MNYQAMCHVSLITATTSTCALTCILQTFSLIITTPHNTMCPKKCPLLATHNIFYICKCIATKSGAQYWPLDACIISQNAQSSTKYKSVIFCEFIYKLQKLCGVNYYCSADPCHDIWHLMSTRLRKTVPKQTSCTLHRYYP